MRTSATGSMKPQYAKGPETRKREFKKRKDGTKPKQQIVEFAGTGLPPLRGKSFHRQPPGSRHMFISEEPNERLRYGLVLQKPGVRQDHHTLLAPRQHDVRPSFVHHEPRR